MKGQIIGTVNCWLCDNPNRVKADKNDHPYFYCDHCGMRIQFVGYEEGIEALNKRMKKISRSEAAAEAKPAAAPIVKEPAPKKKGSLLPWGNA